jgi:NADP-dependent 3-hydroxy acid dehydrogenase YdfG
MERIENKVIVITGASSGIGAAAARKLSALGARVVLAARREDRLSELAASLGKNVLFVKTDVRKQEDVERLIGRAIEQYGQVDVLWNNAGVMPLSFFDEGLVADWERMIDVNIKGVLYGIHAVLGHMLERGSGHIVATSSIQGYKTIPGTGVYAGTKFAVRAIMETLREELAGKVRVTSLHPGLVGTEFGSESLSPKVSGMFGDLGAWPKLNAESVVDAFIYAVSQPDGVGVSDILIRPAAQTI